MPCHPTFFSPGWLPSVIADCLASPRMRDPHGTRTLVDPVRVNLLCFLPNPDYCDTIAALITADCILMSSNWPGFRTERMMPHRTSSAANVYTCSFRREDESVTFGPHSNSSPNSSDAGCEVRESILSQLRLKLDRTQGWKAH